MNRWLRFLGFALIGVTIGLLVSLYFRGRAKTAVPAAQADRPRTTLATAPPEDTIHSLATATYRETNDRVAGESSRERRRVIAMFNSAPDTTERKTALTNFFQAWAHLDPLDALRAARELTDLGLRRRALFTVIQDADPASERALALEVKSWPDDSMPTADRKKLLDAAAGGWAKIDPVAAASFVDSLGPYDEMSFFTSLQSISKAWAGIDPQAALDWTRAHSNHVANDGLMSGWWQKDPSAAETYAASHYSGFFDQSNIAIVAQLIADQDPQRAQSWVESIADPKARMGAETAVASQMALKDPQAACAWATTLGPELQGPAIQSIVNVWAVSDPDAALRYTSQLTGQNRDNATAGLAIRYGMGFNQMNADPAQGANLALTITDSATQMSALQSVIESWLLQNRDAATKMG